MDALESMRTGWFIVMLYILLEYFGPPIVNIVPLNRIGLFSVVRNTLCY